MYEIAKLTIILQYSIRKYNPLLFKNHIQKQMLMTERLQLIDRNPDNFKDWGCNDYCVESPCYCKILTLLLDMFVIKF